MMTTRRRPRTAPATPRVATRRLGLHTVMLFAGTIAASAGTAPVTAAQDSVPAYVVAHYDRHDLMIPMRDGIRLRTIVFTPKDTAIAYPLLLTRTPYGADQYFHPFGPADAFAPAGYIFAFQDVRGKFLSEGTFIDVPPYHEHPGPGAIDEATDTYDTIDWLLAHIPHNNGRVGQYGISYLGYYSTMGILSRHPALKAVSPQAPVTDWFRGDDWHHNGALFLTDGFDFISGFGVPRGAPSNERREGLRHFKPDEYEFFLDSVGPLSAVDDRYFHHQIPFWDSLMAHPTYDAFWRARTPLPHLRDVRPAVLVVGGWFDAEDLWGTLAVYHAVAASNPETRIAMGPWFHAGWFLTDGSSFADLAFPTKTAEDYHAQVELPFFEHYLKDKGTLGPWSAFVYETGADQWRTFDAWPPHGVTSRTLYLGPSHRLDTEAPRASGGTPAFDSYTSDPARPVPYVDGVWSERPAEYMAADQRFAAERPDVLVYETAPLADDLVIAGPTTAQLYVSTTGTDADWIVKLIDVYPDDTPNPVPNPRHVVMGGYEQLVRAEIMRGKFRTSVEHPTAFTPGQITPVTFPLRDAFHEFKRGHRIMVQVQSSWFPLVDRNPQRFEDINRARPGDFVSATERVYHSPAAPSAIRLTILP